MPSDTEHAVASASDCITPDPSISAPDTPWIKRVSKTGLAISNRLDSLFPFSLSLKVLAFVLVLSWYALQPIRFGSVVDLDLGWHLRSGEWIVQHHQLPRTDPFSITGAGKAWVPYSWPFSVLLYEVVKNFDLLGVVWYTVFAWIAAIAGFFLLARLQGAGFWRAIGLTLLCGMIMRRLAAPRPGTVTVLLFLVLFYLLLQERARGYTSRLWIVPVILWIWANIHVQFVYGLFLLGLFCIEPLLNRAFLNQTEAKKRPLSALLWAVLAVSALVTVLTPYGFGSYRVVLDFMHQSRLAGLVTETSPLGFNNPVHYVVLLLLLTATAVLARRKQVEPLWIVLLLWATLSSFRMERDIWLLAAVSVAILATPENHKPVTPESSRLWLYGTLGVLVVLLFAAKSSPTNKGLLAIKAVRLPLGAVAYLHEHQLPGPIFNDYDWGGFLIYALPEYPVSIDGRTNVHGQDEVERSSNTWRLIPGWDSNPLFNQANIIIAPLTEPLTIQLATDPRFKIVYKDSVCVLFQRVNAGAN